MTPVLGSLFQTVVLDILSIFIIFLPLVIISAVFKLLFKIVKGLKWEIGKLFKSRLA